MRTIAIAFAAALSLVAAGAAAQDASCVAEAAQKKLVGAAKDSFMKKCEANTCSAQAAQKKLAGAARTSFMTKCATGKCEADSKAKKLAGAAKASHMKKCVADMVGAS